MWIALSKIKFESKLADLGLFEQAQKNEKLHGFRCDLTSPEKNWLIWSTNPFWKTFGKRVLHFGKVLEKVFWKILGK